MHNFNYGSPTGHKPFRKKSLPSIETPPFPLNNAPPPRREKFPDDLFRIRLQPGASGNLAVFEHLLKEA